MYSLRKFLLVSLVLTLMCSTISIAQIHEVMDNGTLIQNVINAANPGDTILVHPDTYQQSFVIHGRDLILSSLYLTTGDPDYIDNTILEPPNPNQDVIRYNNCTEDGLITGFTIQNGRRGIFQDLGGVMNLAHMVFKDLNNPNDFGGAIHCRYGSLIIRDSEIYDCEARDGGGICLDYADDALIERVNIYSNVARYGGGIRILQDCELTANYVLLADNTASRYGGGIQIWSSGAVLNLTNVTFHGNVDQLNGGGGIRTRLESEVNIVNCIFDDNQPYNILMQNGNSNLDISYSDIIGGQGSLSNAGALVWGPGNIDDDPLFEDPDNNDFHLTVHSPCVNTGDPASPNDPDGTRADMGRYAFILDDPPEVEVTYPNGGEALNAGDDITIEWDVTSPLDIPECLVEYSVDGGASWEEIGTTENNDFDIDWEVPDFYNLYVVIRVTATDDIMGQGYDVSDDWFSVAPVEVTHEFYRGWSFFSLPYIPDNGAKADLIEAGIIDNMPWDLFAFEMATSFYRPDELFCEKGYALSLFQDTLVTSFDCTVNRDMVTMELDNGWNFIGVPFGTNLVIDNQFITYEGNDLSVDVAAGEDYCVPIFYEWSAQDSMYIEAAELEVWKSYFFLTLVNDMTLSLMPAPPGNVPAGSDIELPGTIGEWELNIQTTFDGHTDPRTAIGANAYGSDGFDAALDHPLPPSGEITGVVQSYFEHNDWIPDISRKFNSDIREEMLEGEAEWMMTVSTIRPGEVTLTWDDIRETTPRGYEFEIIDTVEDVTINPRETESYTFDNDGSRVFTIRTIASLAIEDKGSHPTSHQLLSAYPNPFNASLNVQVNLERTSDARIDIMDLNGKLVETICNENLRSGRHDFVWNASNVSNGIYLVQMNTSTGNSTQKVLLLK